MLFNLLSFQGDSEALPPPQGEEAPGEEGGETGLLAEESGEAQEGPTPSPSTAGSRSGPGRVDLAEELLGVITHGFRGLTLQEEVPAIPPTPHPSPAGEPVIEVSSDEEMEMGNWVLDLDNNNIVPAGPMADGLINMAVEDIDSAFYELDDSL